MEQKNNNLDQHDLPPFPSATGILISPPPSSIILSHHHHHPPLGFSSAPQSFFLTPNNNNNNIIPPPPPPHEQQQQQQLHPSFLSSYGGGFPAVGNSNNSEVISNTILGNKDDIIGRRVLDAWTTKVARTKRRLARQKTNFTRSSSSSSSSSSANFDDSSKLGSTHCPNADSQSNNNRNPNLFTFCTPDNKILRMLLKKELKNSDVGSLGRIVLPKREAEENLPFLCDKEGIQIVMRDVNSNRKWGMKYKYWANNRSRMYVLENTGDFVRQNGLLMGDLMTLYEDECKNIYVSVERGENHSNMDQVDEMRKQKQQQQQYLSARGGGSSYINNIKDELEEEESLALLIEELKNKTDEDVEDGLIQQQQQPPPPCTNNNNNNNCGDSYFERSGSRNRYYQSSNNNNDDLAQQEQEGINNNNNNGSSYEDCFGGLDTLPEVSGFKFPLFDYLNNNNPSTT